MKINRELVYNKFNGHCAYCGCAIPTSKDMQVDHIIPKLLFNSRIGYDLNDILNLNPACKVCNNWKSIYSVEEFRIQMQNQVNAARRYSRNFRMAEKFGLVPQINTEVLFYFEKYCYDK